MTTRAAGRPTPTPFYLSEDDAPAKRRILVAALELFVRDGLCETSVRDIAKATGFTNPALFKHFHSKDDLARYLFERCYLELAGLVSRAIASGATFAEKQRAVIDAYLAALDRDANSVLYVQDLLRHFWPQMPDRVRRHSIVGDVRRLLAPPAPKARSAPTSISISSPPRGSARCSSSPGSATSASSNSPLARLPTRSTHF